MCVQQRANFRARPLSEITNKHAASSENRPENRLGRFPVASQVFAVHDHQAGTAPLGLVESVKGVEGKQTLGEFRENVLGLPCRVVGGQPIRVARATGKTKRNTLHLFRLG